MKISHKSELKSAIINYLNQETLRNWSAGKSIFSRLDGFPGNVKRNKQTNKIKFISFALACTKKRKTKSMYLLGTFN